jgi:5-methylcytosine-specific restriction endonuclease McrA
MRNRMVTRSSRPSLGRVGPSRPPKPGLGNNFNKRFGDKSYYGTDAEWRKISAEVRQRDGYVCRHCGDCCPPGCGTKTEADHIVPISRGGRTTLANIQTLCEHCHDKKSGKRRR